MGGSIVYKNILFCTDFSNDAHMAFVHALDLSRKYRAKLYLLHIISSQNPCSTSSETSHTPVISEEPSDESERQMQQQALKAMIKQYVNELDEQDDYDIQVRTGSPDIKIIQFARQFQIDMIVLGAQGRPEKDRRIFVHTAANVSKFAPCQVIAIRSPRNQGTDTETAL
jgi:nucleotide-binding universal stress UspA family protein